jgi:hypothetical protein
MDRNADPGQRLRFAMGTGCRPDPFIGPLEFHLDIMVNQKFSAYVSYAPPGAGGRVAAQDTLRASEDS